MRIIQTADLTPSTKLTQNENDWIYNGLDVCVTLEIVNVLLAQLDDVAANTYQFELDLQGPVLEMSTRGIRIDTERRDSVLRGYREKMKIISDQLDEIIFEGIGVKLNWRSNDQLKKLFYEILGLPPVKKRNTLGKFTPTVDRDALEHISQYLLAEPLCVRLLLLRDLDKKRQFLQRKIDPDNRMRCNLNIAGTNTGRLSSSASDFGTGGNQQNVDREERAIFIADPGMKFCNLDLEQADARNVGAICWNSFVEKFGDTYAGAYLDACESGDLHTTTCRLAWTDLPWTEDAKANKKIAEQIAYRQDSYRQLAKKLGHGTNYYGTPRTMAKHAKVPIKQIEDFQRRYFDGYPCIKEWHSQVKRQIKEEGSLTTLLGRRRCFFGRAEDDSTLREAIAYEPQSLTADEIDLGLIRLFRANRVELLIQVHDSILFQFPEDREEEIVPWAMEQLVTRIGLVKGRSFAVPVDAKTGWNWGDVELKEGNVIGNAEGLMKWKGSDKRKRREVARLSLKALL